MDLYGNDFIMRAESEHRLAELRGDARRSVAPAPATTGERKQWTAEFAAWVTARARIGTTFMARTPMNP